MVLFEAVPDQPGSLKCCPCSAQCETEDVIIRKTYRHQHVKTEKHKVALKRSGLIPEVSERPSAPSGISGQPAVLALADMFAHSDNEDEEFSRMPLYEQQQTADYGDHFIDEDGDMVMFSAGQLPEDNLREELRRKMNALSYGDNTLTRMAFLESSEPDEDVTVSNATAALEAMDLEDDNETEHFVPDIGQAEKDGWAPHGSKTMFMLDLLDNLPRLRLSDDHLKTIIWVMRECGTPHVPTFHALRKVQKQLTKSTAISTQHHVSALGNHFHMNRAVELLSLDWANPHVCPLIRMYPDLNSTVSEFWQAEKWVKEMHWDDLGPMWADFKNAPHRHFYIKELAQLSDGHFVIPLRWVTINNIDYCEAYNVSKEFESSCFTIEKHETCQIPTERLQRNLLDLGFTPQFLEGSPEWTKNMPHPLRKIAQGRPAYVLRIMIWADGVSGNRSKQYNAHDNIYIANLNIPHQKLSQEYFVRFCSTSPDACALEQLEALRHDFATSDDWHSAYHCQLQREIIFRVVPHLLPGENPQQSEECSHASGNLGCRRDFVGGIAEERESDQGYAAYFESHHKCYQPGQPRTREKTIETIKSQILMACTGVRDAIDSIQTQTGVKDKIAEFWINKLIPIAESSITHISVTPKPGDDREAVKNEIKSGIQNTLFSWIIQQPSESYESLPLDSPLRTTLRAGDHYNVALDMNGKFLLGEDKYLWHETSKPWDKRKDDIFATRLESSSLDGLSIKSVWPRYLVRYKNSLIGKHFKSLQQLAVFHLHNDLCDEKIFSLWKASGELEDIARFGPVVLYSTEVFECWNAVFRLCSILSNHQSPSRDIAVTLADMERFKHQASGGWWKNENGEYVQAGHSIRSLFQKNRELQRCLGWAAHSTLKPGGIKLKPNGKRDASTLEVALDHLSTNPDDHRHCNEVGGTWYHCKYLISRSHDICKPNSWVFFHQAECPIQVGHIAKILSPTITGSSENVIAVVEEFFIAATKDLRLNMPLLTRAHRSAIVNPHDVLFIFNAQHNCFGSQCKVVECDEIVTQRDRGNPTQRKNKVTHADDNHYILNMHALHNAHLVRETLPRQLTAPTHYLEDRAAKHKELAATLRIAGPTRRAEAVAKAKATRERKQKASRPADILVDVEAPSRVEEGSHGG
ncbi:hypothetical protein A0H81_13040 [Grifola frondosa]|uniref:Uncharacterized protein n=1 Tax=Grifola frondosa TaxID=5627 RepID=A0A1C7LT42_GRIFR|nr:hypothetical protein A0H81_13040 [Grifola frondosa]